MNKRRKSLEHKKNSISLIEHFAKLRNTTK